MNDSVSPRTASWHLGPDGGWERQVTGPDGEPTDDLQAVLVDRHRRRPSRS